MTLALGMDPIKMALLDLNGIKNQNATKIDSDR